MSTRIFCIFVVILLVIRDEIYADDACSGNLICGVCVGGGADCTASKSGEGYDGKVSKTVGDLECQKWSEQTPHRHGFSRLGENNFCRNPDGEPAPWCYTTSKDKRWDLCTVPLCTPEETQEKFNVMKEVYKKCIENPKCGDCKEIIEEYLPDLCEEDQMKEGDIGIDDGLAYAKTDGGWFPYGLQDFMTTLPLLTGEDTITVRTKNQEVKINGTVNGYVGKRWYGSSYRKHRPTGLYAAQGDIVTITIPEKLVGKIKVQIGHSFELVDDMWITPKKSVCNIGSPWGGLIQIFLIDEKATKGEFSITVDNAIKAPEFVYGQTNNDDWKNEIRKYSPKWTVLRVPGQLDVYVQTLKINHITDMEKTVSSWKKTMDLLEEMIGLPPNTLPGAEEMRFQTGMVDWLGGYHAGICASGLAAMNDKFYLESKEKTRNAWWLTDGTYYDDWFHGKGVNHIVLHELGHGFCHSHLPAHGGQWFADYTADYINFKLGYLEEHSAEDDMNFDLLYRMVAFGLHSDGKPCGKAEFTKEQLVTGSYDTCWKFLNTIPAIEFGYDILSQVNKLVVQSDQSYASKEERHVDLYCKASKHNLMPLFDFYNIGVSQSIRESCVKLPETTVIAQWLDVVDCIWLSMGEGEGEDIPAYSECSKLPLYPEHKGVCTFTGVCSYDKAYGREVNMKNQFDLYDRSGSSSQDKQKCFDRAGEIYTQCGNAENQPITATFSTDMGASELTIPRSGADVSNCYYDKPRNLPDYKGSSSDMTPAVCNEKCKDYAYSGVQYYNECWCGNDAPPLIRMLDKEACDTMCYGDKTQRCGGGWKINIMKVSNGSTR